MWINEDLDFFLQNTKRGETHATLNLFLETASGFYLQVRFYNKYDDDKSSVEFCLISCLRSFPHTETSLLPVEDYKVYAWAFELGGIFIVRCGTLILTVSSERQSHFVVSYDKKGKLRNYSNGDPYVKRIIWYTTYTCDINIIMYSHCCHNQVKSKNFILHYILLNILFSVDTIDMYNIQTGFTI